MPVGLAGPRLDYWSSVLEQDVSVDESRLLQRLLQSPCWSLSELNRLHKFELDLHILLAHPVVDLKSRSKEAVDQEEPVSLQHDVEVHAALLDPEDVLGLLLQRYHSVDLEFRRCLHNEEGQLALEHFSLHDCDAQWVALLEASHQTVLDLGAADSRVDVLET